jgi:putative acetyltransferase
MRIRPAGSGDHDGIRAVVEAAFGRPDEAALVDALRAEGASLVELVAAAKDGAVLGHVLFTALGIERAGEGEGPGVAVVVLGDPAYYPRLGFRADLAAGLDTPFPGPAFMALELVPGALAAGGRVRYAASFGLG